MKINKLQQYIWATEFLIQDKKNWTTKEFARNSKNKEVGIYSADAVKWCLMGALDYVVDPVGLYTWTTADERFDVHRFVQQVAIDQQNVSVTQINDACGHEAVLNLLNQSFIEAGKK